MFVIVKCKCGNVLTDAYIRSEPSGQALQNSFAVVKDSDYLEFLREELEVVNGSEFISDSLIRASKYVSSLHICEICGRLIWIPSGDGVVRFYNLDNGK